MVVVDTSFLVALHFEGDRFHRAALEVPLGGDRFLVPREIWTEFADVAMRLAPRGAERILTSAQEGPFDIQAVLDADEYAGLIARSHAAQAAARRAGRRPLSLFDLVVCSVAQRFREEILTFDNGIVEAVRTRAFPGARLA